MAVDTAEKRFSMLNFGDGNHLHMSFEADGTVDLDDRQHLLDCYSGIAFGLPAVVIPVIQLTNKIFVYAEAASKTFIAAGLASKSFITALLDSKSFTKSGSE